MNYNDMPDNLRKTLDDLKNKIVEIESLQRSIIDNDGGYNRILIQMRLGHEKDGLLYAINTIYQNFQIYHSE